MRHHDLNQNASNLAKDKKALASSFKLEREREKTKRLSAADFLEAVSSWKTAERRARQIVPPAPTQDDTLGREQALIALMRWEREEEVVNPLFSRKTTLGQLEDADWGKEQLAEETHRDLRLTKQRGEHGTLEDAWDNLQPWDLVVYTPSNSLSGEDTEGSIITLFSHYDGRNELGFVRVSVERIDQVNKSWYYARTSRKFTRGEIKRFLEEELGLMDVR